MSTIATGWRSDSLAPREIAGASNALAFDLFARRCRETADNVVLAPAGPRRPELAMRGGLLRLRARWERCFPPEATSEGVFFVDVRTDDVTSLSTMRRRFERHQARFADGRSLQVLELPYQGGLSAVFFLPRRADALPLLEAKLGADAVADCLDSLRAREVDVTLPRCEVVDDGVAFSLDEDGTLPAATHLGTCLPEDRMAPLFVADHPFAFLVRERATGLVVLLGRVVDPR